MIGAMRFLLCLVLIPSLAFAQTYKSDEQTFRVVKLVQGLDHPWSLAFLPDGRMLVTDRKSTRLNSSHTVISYAVFCLKKKNADSQLGGAVHQQMRHLGGQHHRFFLVLVIVGDKVDGVPVDVGQKFHRQRREAALRISH